MRRQLTTFNLNALLITLAFCLISCYTHAKDITNEQRNAYEARQQYNKNKSSYEGLLTRVSQQEQRVAEAQERLNQLKAEEAEAKAALEQSKVDLDNKTKALNDVWDLRNQ